MKLTDKQQNAMFERFFAEVAPEYENAANEGLIRGLLKTKGLPVNRENVELAFKALGPQLGKGDINAIRARKKQLEEDARPKVVPEKPLPEWGVLSLATIKAIPPDKFRVYFRNPQFKAELAALKLKR